MLISQQNTELDLLAGQLCVQFDVSVPINDVIPNFALKSIIGRFHISNNSLSGMFADQVSWATELFETLDQAAQSDVRFQIASTIIAIIGNLCDLQAERKEDNLADDDLPPFLPHVLVRLRPLDFALIVSRFRDRSQPCWDDGSIAGIEIDFQEFKIAVQTEETLAASLAKCDDVNASFEEGWRLVQGRFVRLRDFCCYIATAYPKPARSRATSVS